MLSAKELGERCRGLASNGWSADRIAAELSAPLPIVTEAINGAPHKEFERRLRSSVAWLFDRGKTNRSIAKELDLPLSTIDALVRDHKQLLAKR